MPPRVRAAGSQTSKERVRLAIARLRTAPRHVALSKYADRLADIGVLVDAHLSLAGPGQGGSRQAHALNRAALIMLTGHFSGFVLDLFDESWAAKYVGSKPVRLTEGFNNPWPREIDKLYQSLGYIGLTGQVDPRSTMPRVDVSAFVLPTLVREPTRHTDFCVRSVIDELVLMRTDPPMADRSSSACGT